MHLARARPHNNILECYFIWAKCAWYTTNTSRNMLQVRQGCTLKREIGVQLFLALDSDWFLGTFGVEVCWHNFEDTINVYFAYIQNILEKLYCSWCAAFQVAPL